MEPTLIELEKKEYLPLHELVKDEIQGMHVVEDSEKKDGSLIWILWTERGISQFYSGPLEPIDTKGGCITQVDDQVTISA